MYYVVQGIKYFIYLCIGKLIAKQYPKMKKVVNVSVGGRSFSLDEDAYSRLNIYFDHFRARIHKGSGSADASSEEVMSDLESRIAELFSQSTGGVPNRVVDLALVSKVVEQLGMPDGTRESEFQAGGSNAGYSGQDKQAGGDSAASGPDFSYSGTKGDARRRLFRDPDNKAIAGVCSGLGAFLNIDITVVRILALVLVLGYGTGLLIYLVLWIAVPLAKTPADKCEMKGLEPNAENLARFSQQKKNDNGKQC